MRAAVILANAISLRHKFVASCTSEFSFRESSSWNTASMAQKRMWAWNGKHQIS